MRRALITGLVPLLLCGLVWGGESEYRQQWDKDQERAVREGMIPIASRLDRGAAIRTTLEKALAGDPSAVPALIALLDDGALDVALSAAALLGRFPGGAAAGALKQRLAGDPRVEMRAVAMMALGRMGDPEAGELASGAVRGPDLVMRGAGGVALGLLGNSRYAGVVLEYLDGLTAAGGLPDEEAFEVLASIGDPPGSTIVTDRLLAEANNKQNAIEVRYAAAFALEKMGRAARVQPLLDLDDADSTWRNMLSFHGVIQRLAGSKGLSVDSQAVLDSVLGQVGTVSVGGDFWGRPLRARLASPGEYHVISDGPDGTPDTADDMSTEESFDAYEQRVFGDLF
jgi:hypothetical protein